MSNPTDRVTQCMKGRTSAFVHTPLRRTRTTESMANMY